MPRKSAQQAGNHAPVPVIGASRLALDWSCKMNRPAMNPQAQILIVDDDEEITTLLGSYLTRFNFVTHTAVAGLPTK